MDVSGVAWFWEAVKSLGVREASIKRGRNTRFPHPHTSLPPHTSLTFGFSVFDGHKKLSFVPAERIQKTLLRPFHVVESVKSVSIF
jgi:hypothetical protein